MGDNEYVKLMKILDVRKCDIIYILYCNDFVCYSCYWFFFNVVLLLFVICIWLKKNGNVEDNKVEF